MKNKSMQTNLFSGKFKFMLCYWLENDLNVAV